MTAYAPQPYSDLKPVPRSTLYRYSDLDVSLELADPADEDADWIEHQFTLFYRVSPAEPDVGIMSEYSDDWFYAMPDGSPVPEPVHKELDQIGAYAGNGFAFGPDGKNALLNPTITSWHERNMENALADLPY